MADKSAQCRLMKRAGHTDAEICNVLSVTPGFLSRSLLAKGELTRAQSTMTKAVRYQHAAPPSAPAIDSARADVAAKARDLCKSVKLTVAKGRAPSKPGALIADLIKRQVAAGSTYEMVRTLLNPDGLPDGISLYAIKAVCEYGETLV